MCTLFGHTSARITGQKRVNPTSTCVDTLFIISLALVSVKVVLVYICLSRGSTTTKGRLSLFKWMIAFEHHVRDPYIVLWSTLLCIGNILLALVLSYQMCLFDELVLDEDGFVAVGGRLAAVYLAQRLTLNQSPVYHLVLSTGSAAGVAPWRCTVLQRWQR